jgi:hypothetical protein
MAAAESAGELPQLWAGAWDPHDAHRFVTAGGNHLQARPRGRGERDAPRRAQRAQFRDYCALPDDHRMCGNRCMCTRLQSMQLGSSEWHPCFTRGRPARARGCQAAAALVAWPDRAARTWRRGKQVWDLRAMRRTAEVAGAHQMPVRDVDFAAGREHLLLSAGDDCRLRFWDLRRAPAPPPPLRRALEAGALLGPAARSALPPAPVPRTASRSACAGAVAGRCAAAPAPPEGRACRHLALTGSVGVQPETEALPTCCT